MIEQGVVVACHQELSDYHWLRVYHVLTQKRQELDAATDKPVYRCDEVMITVGSSKSTIFVSLKIILVTQQIMSYFSAF